MPLGDSNLNSDRLDFDVMIIGAQKAGTSTLLSHLVRAPRVAPMLRPEVAYFTDTGDFARGTRKAIDKYFGSRDLSGLLRIGEDVRLLASADGLARLLDDSPRVQLVGVLRDPVDRAYSAYWFARRKGFEPSTSFSGAIQRELEGKNRLFSRQDLREYLRGGEYDVHLDSLFRHVDPARVRVILFEDLRSNPRNVANEILEPFRLSIPTSISSPTRTNAAARARSERFARFMGSPLLRRTVRSIVSPAIRGHIERRLRGLNEVPFKPLPMDEAVRAQRAAYFTPHNERLADLIGRDLDGWGRVRDRTSTSG